MLASMICFAITAGLCFLLRLHYARENARRDRLEAENGPFQAPDFADLTDMENLVRLLSCFGVSL